MSARFAIVPAIALEDERISHACLRVLVTLGKFTDKRGWCWPSLTTLAAAARMRRDEICRHLKNLQIWGYLDRLKGNARKTTGYLVKFDFPAFGSTDEPDYQDKGSTDHPDYPSTGGPYSERPTERSKKEPYTNSYDNTPESECDTNIVASGKPKQPRTKHAYPPGFEKFWESYPQRGTDSKSVAFAAWDKARKNEKVSETELQDACERYANYAARTDCQTMLVQTWCNRRCWTSSYHIGSHDNGKGHKREDWYGRRILERAARRAAEEAEAEPRADFPELESRAASW